jgi:hypothetical protein
LAAYDWFTFEAGGQRGAVMLGDEMIEISERQPRRRSGWYSTGDVDAPFGARIRRPAQWSS